MVTAGDFRNGMTIQMDGSIWQVIEFQHVKPGKGSPFVRTKLKNIINGGVVENSYNPTAKFDLAHIDKSEYQYLYAEEDLVYLLSYNNNVFLITTLYLVLIFILILFIPNISLTATYFDLYILRDTADKITPVLNIAFSGITFDCLSKFIYRKEIEYELSGFFKRSGGLRKENSRKGG